MTITRQQIVLASLCTNFISAKSMTSDDKQEAITAIYKDQYLSLPENIHQRDALVLRMLETEKEQKKHIKKCETK